MKPKQDLREQFKQVRAQISDIARQSAPYLLCKFLERYPKGTQWLSYKAIHTELDLDEHFKWAIARGDSVYFPKTEGKKMSFYRLNSLNDLEPGPFTPEPPTTEKWLSNRKTIALVPGLVFSPNGFRIGYGQGFYDQFFAAHSSVYRLGVCFSPQVYLNKWPQEDHDKPVDLIWTPAGFWRPGAA